MWSARRTASSGEDVADVERPHKRPGFPGEGKETLAYRKDGASTRPSVTTATPPMERRLGGPEALSDPSAPKCRVVPGHVDDPSFTEYPPLRRRGRRRFTRPAVAPANGNDAGPPRAPPRPRRDEQRHARPGRAADEDRADNRERLAPAFGRHADMGEPNVAW